MKIKFLLLGTEFLRSRWFGSVAKGEGRAPAEWPGNVFIKRSSGRELVRSTPRNDSTPDKVLRDIGDDTITLQGWKRLLIHFQDSEGYKKVKVVLATSSMNKKN